MTSHETLHRLHLAYLLAYGTDQHPQTTHERRTFALMEAALNSEDEAVCAAVLTLIERTSPKETKGLAAVASEISSDSRAPSLWCAVDIENLAVPTAGSLYESLRNKPDSVVPTWHYRRETAAHVNGGSLACRVLVADPGGMPAAHLDAAARLLRDSVAHVRIVGMREESRRAHLAAAIDRTASKKSA